MNCTVEGMTLNRFQELVLYLLQLVQALKFESSSNEQRSSRSTSNVISYEDSGLSDFLITRSVRNPVLGNRLHWYLMVEVSMEDRVMAKMFARVDWNFMRKVEEVICHH
jgi:phosphatidylinositol 3-kinase